MSNFPPPPPGGQPPAGQPPYQPPPGGQPPVGGQPPYQPPPVDPLAEADSKRKKQLGILSVVAAILIVAAFFGGKAIEKKNYDPGKSGYNEIYAEGAKNGNAAGEASGTKAGEKKGTAKGEAEGEAQGTEKGKAEGEAQGTADGASQALGGLGTWSTTAPYVVQMEQGPSSDVPYTVSSRTPMQPGIFYKICSSGQGVCTEADTGSASTSSSGSGGSNSGATGQ
jgi:hypothetical protein